MRILKLLLAGLAFALCAQAHAQVKLTFWSHWAAEKIKRDYVEDAIKRFEAANPGVKIEAQWYEKTALYAALKTALRAGTAPDIFYAEPDQVEYMENGAAARSLVPQLGRRRAVGEGDLVLQGQAVRPAARGQHGRALLQQEAARRPRRQGAREPAARLAGDDRPGEEGARQEPHADVARRRRPALSGRLPGAGVDAEEARRRRSTTTC